MDRGFQPEFWCALLTKTLSDTLARRCLANCLPTNRILPSWKAFAKKELTTKKLVSMPFHHSNWRHLPSIKGHLDRIACCILLCISLSVSYDLYAHDRLSFYGDDNVEQPIFWLPKSAHTQTHAEQCSTSCDRLWIGHTPRQLQSLFRFSNFSSAAY